MFVLVYVALVYVPLRILLVLTIGALLKPGGSPVPFESN